MTWGEFKTLIEKEGVEDKMLLQFIGINFFKMLQRNPALKVKLPEHEKGLRIYD